jgi:hypothetical protein
LLTENSNLNSLSLHTDSNNKIIVFDLKTHSKLNKLGIKHEIVEDYFNTEDNKIIEELVYQKLVKWHKQDWLAKYIYLENINLGSLLDQFIGIYFLQIVKKFVCIIRILNSEQPSFVTAPEDLAKIVKEITKSNKIQINLIPGNKQNLLYFDKIEIPIKFGRKTFTIWFSRKNFFKIKNFVEKISINIFNLKPNLNEKFKPESIILLDFNSILDGDFITNLSTLNKQIVLLNTRKPAIWNLVSFKKITNSKAKILRLEDFMNKKIESDILKIYNQIENNLDKIKDKKEFENFFSFEGYTFWPIMKDDFIKTCSKYFKEAVTRFELTKILFKQINVKSLLILYPNAAEEKVIIHVAQESKIPGIILQHGVPPYTKYYEKFLPLFYPSEQRGLVHAIWNITEKKYLKNIGINEDDIVLTGSHRLDSVFKIINQCTNNGTILVASSTLAKQDELLDSSTLTAIAYANMLKNICRISNNVEDKKLIVKLHPAQSPSFDAREIIGDVDKSIPIYQHENIVNFLKDCDVLVCMEYSTILLEAMILNKPTITCLVYSDWFEDDEMIRSGATLTVKSAEDFQSSLDRILNDKEFRDNLIKKGNDFAKNFLANHDTGTKSILQLLKKY